MVYMGAVENPLREAGLHMLTALAMVFSFIGVYYVKQETPFLNFIPEDPVVFVILVAIILEFAAFSALAYDQL